MTNHKAPGRLSQEIMIVAAMLVLAAGVRLFGAWCWRFNLNLDSGVVALMAKHMAEGGSLPVFFYGQAYMGSLEPAVSAFFCKVFGVTGFAVNLGTVFFSLLLVLVVYFWARDIGGYKAGIASAVFCIIVGPEKYSNTLKTFDISSSLL